MTITAEIPETTVTSKEISIPNGYYQFDTETHNGYTRVTDDGITVVINKPKIEFIDRATVEKHPNIHIAVFSLGEVTRRPCTAAEFEAAYTATSNELAKKVKINIHGSCL